MTTLPGYRIKDRHARPDRPPPGVRLAVGATAAVLAALAASMLPGSDSVLRTLIVVVAVAAFAGWADDWRPALATAAVGFLLVDGFLVDRYGQLAWHGGADGLRLAAFVGAAVVGTWLGRMSPATGAVPRTRPRS